MKDFIECSPAAVAAHDKAAWLALFARHFTLEDPVGSRPVNAQSPGTIDRFYDTFIAPNTIRFDVYRDYFGPRTVVRDLDIHITMSPAVSVCVPMHLSYELCTENGGLKISRLAAHWELVPMISRLLKCGTQALPVMSSLSGRMIKQMGIGGMLGFSQAALTPRKQHYRLLDDLIVAINCQDHIAVKRCMVSEDVSIIDSEGKKLPLAGLRGIKVEKRIAAGQWISASVTLAETSGVLLGEICQKHKKLLNCTIYC
jgi:hypothetical protein